MGCILKGNSGLYSRMTVGAVLLAGGAGVRLGRRPKALLELGGVPLVLRQLIALSGAGVDEVVVVLGHHAEAVEAAVRAFPITLVHETGDGDADGDGDGEAAAVRAGLRALSPKIDAVIVAPADLPLIDAQDIVALISAYKQRGDAQLVVPRVTLAGGAAEAGKLAIFDALLREQWRAGDAGPASRGWRERHAERVRWFDTDNRRYCLDIDTADDIERFAASTGHRLQWPEVNAMPEVPAVPVTPTASVASEGA